MVRDVQIWLLLKKLQNECWEKEAKHPEHLDQTGHNFKGVVVENDFLDTVSKGNKKKRAKYVDYLVLAKKWIHSEEDQQICRKCGGEIRKVILIRLNEDGLEYIGLFSFLQNSITKYKDAWIYFILPMFGAFFIGVNIHTILRFIIRLI